MTDKDAGSFETYMATRMKEQLERMAEVLKGPPRSRWDRFVFSRFGRKLPTFFMTLGGRWHNWGQPGQGAAFRCWKCWTGRNHNFGRWSQSDTGICMCCGFERWAKGTAL